MSDQATPLPDAEQIRGEIETLLEAYGPQSLADAVVAKVLLFVGALTAERNQLAAQRDAALALAAEAFTDAGAQAQEGGEYPDHITVDAHDLVKALGTDSTAPATDNQENEHG